MEEVWKDITLPTTASIIDHRPQLHPTTTTTHRSSTTNPSHLRGMILQDFLARPFKETTVSSAQPVPAMTTEERLHHNDMGLLGSPPPPPATILSLNSGVDFQYMDAVMPGSKPANNFNSHTHTHTNHHHRSATDPLSSSYIAATAFSDAVGSPNPGLFSLCNSKRRISEQQQLDGSDVSGGGGGDRRHKRMIKNRESAARSRARKQAYTNELELEVSHLQDENARLRREHELRVAMAAQLSTKKKLHRSSTAPF